MRQKEILIACQIVKFSRIFAHEFEIYQSLYSSMVVMDDGWIDLYYIINTIIWYMDIDTAFWHLNDIGQRVNLSSASWHTINKYFYKLHIG